MNKISPMLVAFFLLFPLFAQAEYQGNNREPITLHKYLYGNGNPVSNTDPSGYFVGDIRSLAVGEAVQATLIQSQAQTIRAAGSRTVIKRVSQVAAFAAFSGMSTSIMNKSNNDDSPPMFLVGNTHPQLKNHVQEAFGIGIHPIVHRLGSGNKHSRGWLYTSLTKGKCGSGLTGGNTNNDCDEFPMAAHAEGGVKNYMAGRVSVQAVPLSQNRSIGALVEVFHNACDIKADDPGFDGAYIFGVTNGPTQYNCGVNK